MLQNQFPRAEVKRIVQEVGVNGHGEGISALSGRSEGNGREVDDDWCCAHG